MEHAREDINRLRMVSYFMRENARIDLVVAERLVTLRWLVEEPSHRNRLTGASNESPPVAR